MYTTAIGRGIGNSIATSYKPSSYAKSNMYYYKMFYWSYIIVESGFLGSLLMIFIYCVFLYYSFLLRRSIDSFHNLIGMIGWPFIALIVFMNYYSMAMVKINFAVIAWVIMGLIAKYYLEMRGVTYE